jgi:glutathione-regulated potassium-efflux system ancillary protein KefG
MRNLVLLSHPTLATSRANAPLVNAIRDLPNVEIRHLEALYPDGRIDVSAEQAAALRAERIVFQFPFYWYTTPPALKRWQDDVLAFGWAYGPGGTMLRGKTLQLVLTTGGPEAVYRVGGYNLYPVQELLRPLEVTAHLCGMTLAEPLVLYGVPNIPGLVIDHDPTAAIAEFAARYRALIAG